VLLGGTKARVAKVISKIRTFFWLGSLDRVHTGKAWDVYCLPRADDGLNLLDPREALTALMVK
jgi:hypothetical protein